VSGAAQISATFDWHRSRFTVTGWAEAGRWIAVSGVVAHMGAGQSGRADGDDARAIVQAAGVVADFLADLSDAARADPDRAASTLQDFAEALSRTPMSAASALGALLAAMAGAETGSDSKTIQPDPRLHPSRRADGAPQDGRENEEVSHGDRS